MFADIQHEYIALSGVYSSSVFYFSSEQSFPYLDYITVASSFYLWFSYENRTVSISRTYGFQFKTIRF